MPRRSTEFHRPRIAAVLLAGLAAAAAANERGIISACADGDLAMCEQLSLSGGDAVTGNSALDRRARAFAVRVREQGFAEQPAPDLAGAYPLVVGDYFDAPTITAAERAQFYHADALADCAAHYADTWLVERNWWPADEAGRVLWHLVYYHVVDHYFGYCLRRVPPAGRGIHVPARD